MNGHPVNMREHHSMLGIDNEHGESINDSVMPRFGMLQIMATPERDERADEYLHTYVAQAAHNRRFIIVLDDKRGTKKKAWRTLLTEKYGYELKTVDFGKPGRTATWRILDSMVFNRFESAKEIAHQYADILILNAVQHSEMDMDVQSAVHTVMMLAFLVFNSHIHFGDDDTGAFLARIYDAIGLKTDMLCGVKGKDDNDTACTWLRDTAKELKYQVSEPVLMAACGYVKAILIDPLCDKRNSRLFGLDGALRTDVVVNQTLVPRAIFVRPPEESASPLMPFVPLFIQYALLPSTVFKSKQDTIHVLLDDFIHGMGYIPYFQTAIHRAKEQDVSCVLGMDNMDEFCALYGQDMSMQILSEANTTILFPAKGMWNDRAMTYYFQTVRKTDMSELANYRAALFYTHKIRKPLVVGPEDERRHAV